MATILAGRFENITPAERAARALLRAGIAETDLSIFHVNAPGQHHLVILGGEDRGPEGQPSRRALVVGATVGALVLGVLGMAAGQYLVPRWGWLAAVLGAAIGAYLGSFIGALTGSVRRPRWHPFTRRRGSADRASAPRLAGIVLAIHLREPGFARKAADLLRAHGGKYVELTEGKWDQGWVDFDPVHELIEETTASAKTR
jgi:hypothetical protein